MICNMDYDSNLDTYKILSLLDQWYAEDYIDVPSTLHIRESYALKYQSQEHDTPMYMDALSDEYMAE